MYIRIELWLQMYIYFVCDLVTYVYKDLVMVTNVLYGIPVSVNIIPVSVNIIRIELQVKLLDQKKITGRTGNLKL